MLWHKFLQVRCPSHGDSHKRVCISWFILCRSQSISPRWLSPSSVYFESLTFYNRSDSIHQGRQCISCYHGQANLSVNRKGHYFGCVRSISLPFIRWPKPFLRMAYRVRQGRNFVTPPTGLSYTGSSVPICPFSSTRNPNGIKLQVPLPNGLSRRGRLYTKSGPWEGPGRPLPPSCRSRIKCIGHHSTANGQLPGRPVFCHRVSSFEFI